MSALPRPESADRRRAELDRLSAGLVSRLSATPLGLAGLTGALDEDEWLAVLVEQALIDGYAAVRREMRSEMHADKREDRSA